MFQLRRSPTRANLPNTSPRVGVFVRPCSACHAAFLFVGRRYARAERCRWGNGRSFPPIHRQGGIVASRNPEVSRHARDGFVVEGPDNQFARRHRNTECWLLTSDFEKLYHGKRRQPVSGNSLPPMRYNVSNGAAKNASPQAAGKGDQPPLPATTCRIGTLDIACMSLFRKNKDRWVQSFILKLVNNNCPDLRAMMEGPRDRQPGRPGGGCEDCSAGEQAAADSTRPLRP